MPCAHVEVYLNSANLNHLKEARFVKRSEHADVAVAKPFLTFNDLAVCDYKKAIGQLDGGSVEQIIKLPIWLRIDFSTARSNTNCIEPLVMVSSDFRLVEAHNDFLAVPQNADLESPSG